MRICVENRRGVDGYSSCFSGASEVGRARACAGSHFIPFHSTPFHDLRREPHRDRAARAAAARRVFLRVVDAAAARRPRSHKQPNSTRSSQRLELANARASPRLAARGGGGGGGAPDENTVQSVRAEKNVCRACVTKRVQKACAAHVQRAQTRGEGERARELDERGSGRAFTARVRELVSVCHTLSSKLF